MYCTKRTYAFSFSSISGCKGTTFRRNSTQTDTGNPCCSGFSREELKEESLTLYKTGRTNANDGGIDFVMKPLGRFFQVTETLDFKKYFLDIEKIEHYPITFVVKSEEEADELRKKLYDDAIKTYAVDAIVKRYMECIEELINIPRLREVFEEVKKRGDIPAVLDEIILQSKVEFNFDDDDD